MMLALSVGVCGGTSAAASTRVFVDDDAPVGGDGASWASAFKTLQDALSYARSNDVDEIWVAAGLYHPDEGGDAVPGDRDATFSLIGGVGLYGGFAGDEDPLTFDLATRDFVANETILSGDLLDNSNGANVNSSDNARHVVAVIDQHEAALLSGFTISDGCAEGGTVYAWYDGGGVWAKSSRLTVEHCLFVDNYAYEGGAMHLGYGVDATLVGCRFIANEADCAPAIYSQGACEMRNCLAAGNIGYYSGAVDIASGDALIVGCTIVHNQSRRRAGGLCSWRPTVVKNSILWGNVGEYAGGESQIDGAVDGDVMLANCVVQWWRPALGGTGVVSADPLFVDADGYDGNPFTPRDNDYRLADGSPAVDGGDPLAVLAGELDLTRSSRVQDCRPDCGAIESAYFHDRNGNEEADGCETAANPALDVNNNGVPDGLEPDCNGNGVPDDYDIFGAVEYDCNLNGVPDACEIVAGAVEDADNDGVPDECQTPAYCFVRADAPPGGDGRSWATAHRSLQDALFRAYDLPVAEIWVAAGAYAPDDGQYVAPGDIYAVFVANGAPLRGGFAGDEDPATFDLADRDLKLNAAVLTGDLLQDDTPNFDAVSDNSRHVVTTRDAACEIDGFVIRGGCAEEDAQYSWGGGFLNRADYAVVRNCVFEDNSGKYGGAVYGGDSGAIDLLDCEFRNNYARVWNGAVDMGYSGSKRVIGCTFVGNGAYGGAGAGDVSADCIVDRCVFAYNYSAYNGALNMFYDAQPVISNSLFIGNRSGNGGGAVYVQWNSTPTFVNCTFVDNTSEDRRGMAVKCDSHEQIHPSMPRFYNCLFWNPGGTEVVINDGSVMTMEYCDVRGGWAGAGNFSVDPAFVDADGADNDPLTWEDNDYRLSLGSPCVGAGSNAVVPVDADLDLDGAARIQGGRVDCGAYETPYASGADCDGDGLSDADSIAQGVSNDVDGNGIPDECEPDCNANGAPDSYDISSGAFADVNENGTPDVCEDCNGNGVLDELDVASGAFEDCNLNRVPDECDIARGASPDDNGDGAPDECALPAPRFVRADAPFGGTGLSWATAYRSLDDALRVARELNVTEIWAAKGCYALAEDVAGEPAYLLPSGVKLYGGFAGHEPYAPEQLAARDVDANVSVISGVAPNGPVRHVLQIEEHAVGVVLDGFTVIGGSAYGESADDVRGGGLLVNNAQAEVRNCAFVYNSASVNGGGVFVGEHGDVAFSDCAFVENQADNGGGLAYEGALRVAAQRCRFYDNSAAEMGGGAYVDYTFSGAFTECDWQGNAARYGGAVTVAIESTIDLRDCLIAGNRSSDVRGAGGGACVFHAAALFDGCTIVGNTSPAAPGGVSSRSADAITLVNCILWGNESTRASGEAAQVASMASMTYCCVEGLESGGEGNFGDDPLFMQPGHWESETWIGGDYALQTDSPCIDAGAPTTTAAGRLDLNGLCRVWDGDADGVRRIDCGAYEFGASTIGDLNCDGVIDPFDIDPFVQALVDGDAYAQNYPHCSRDLADANGDGAVNAFDIDPFVDLLIGQ